MSYRHFLLSFLDTVFLQFSPLPASSAPFSYRHPTIISYILPSSYASSLHITHHSTHISYRHTTLLSLYIILILRFFVLYIHPSIVSFPAIAQSEALDVFNIDKNPHRESSATSTIKRLQHRKPLLKSSLFLHLPSFIHLTTSFHVPYFKSPSFMLHQLCFAIFLSNLLLLTFLKKHKTKQPNQNRYPFPAFWHSKFEQNLPHLDLLFPNILTSHQPRLPNVFWFFPISASSEII